MQYIKVLCKTLDFCGIHKSFVCQFPLTLGPADLPAE